MHLPFGELNACLIQVACLIEVVTDTGFTVIVCLYSQC